MSVLTKAQTDELETLGYKWNPTYTTLTKLKKRGGKQGVITINQYGEKNISGDYELVQELMRELDGAAPKHRRPRKNKKQPLSEPITYYYQGVKLRVTTEKFNYAVIVDKHNERFEKSHLRQCCHDLSEAEAVKRDYINNVGGAYKIVKITDKTPTELEKALKEIKEFYR